METPTIETIDLKRPSLYINRELSQIEFNRRVLGESLNEKHPLLERAKFIAIFASNMDEFFMVRVSGLKQQLLLGIMDVAADGLTPREQLLNIHQTVTQLLNNQMNNWQTLHPLLAEAGIVMRDYDQLKSKRKRKLRNYFEREVFPALTPLAFDPAHPFPHISNLSLNLAVVLRDPDSNVTHFARVKVPSTLPRLVPLRRYAPDDLLLPTEQKFVWIEEVIKANLDRLFPGMEIVDAYPFRVTRNNDMEIQEEEADDLLLTIEANLRQRHFGSVVRLEVDEKTPEPILDVLMRNLEVGLNDVYTVDGPLGLECLWELHRLERPNLKDEPFRPKHVVPHNLSENLFDLLSQRDLLIHRPYDSFADVIKFIELAATDPDVLAIKMTLYRVGPNPAVVNALMQARTNGKQVTVLVELKARFDEESNIVWARALEKAGVHVVYGVIGLKTHAKIALVVRRERTGMRRYLHLSTGNYNAITARFYTDLDYLTCDEALGADASEVFNVLTGFSKQDTYRKFLVAPVNLRDNLLRFIQDETRHGTEGHIIFKCNSLVDPATIRALYMASIAGVKIDLIVRGICCLRPGLPKISENIRVLSIVGRFLEHSRIYYFKNQDNPILYVGSADLMQRNLDRRVEVLFPIDDDAMQREIVENILDVQLRDNEQGYWLKSDGTYQRAAIQTAEDENVFNSQTWFLNGRATHLPPIPASIPVAA